MSRKLMNLALIMATTTAYAYEYKNDPFPLPYYNPDGLLPKGNIPSDKQKCQPKQQHKFSIKGVEIMAASKKDAIKKYKHLKGKYESRIYSRRRMERHKWLRRALSS